MLSFLEHTMLLEYKKIMGSGKKADRHYDEYISPHSVGQRESPEEKDSPITTIKHVIHPETGKVLAQPDSRVTPIAGTKKVDERGQHSSMFHVKHPDGSTSKVRIPHGNLKTETEKTGKHVDEHAVIKAWNHFSSSPSTHRTPEEHVAHMHSEIDKAEKDEKGKHPLAIERADKSEFTHGVNGHGDSGSTEVRARARKTYYGNLRDAAHTISSMSRHPDFKNHWKAGDTLEGAGRSRPELSDTYKNAGVKGAGATSKSDVITVKVKNKKTGQEYKGVKTVSLKQGGGSQLMSSSPAEFEAIYTHALHKTFGKHLTEARALTHKQALAHVKRIREHLERGEHEHADKLIGELHDHLDKKGLLRNVAEEALTGRGKFKNVEGTATHIATIGKGGKISKADDYLNSHMQYMKRPRATKGKHGEGTTAVRLDTPRIPKKKVVIKKKT